MRLLLALAAGLAAILGGAAPAGACSCVGGDPRDRLSGAQAAFVGTVAEERVTPTGERRYRLTVEATYKGELPASVEVTSDSRSSCGIDLGIGERVGLLLRRATAPYEVGTCDLIEPHRLEAATRPYPAGMGVGTARLLVAGAFHDAGLAALDGRGRLIGWAFGSSGDAVSVCPGARFAVQAGDGASTIRLRDLAVVARRPLPDEATSALRCLSRSGDRLAAVTFRYGARSDHRRLVVMRDRRIRDLGVRDGVAADLGMRSAYLAIGASGSHRIVALHYSSQRTRSLVMASGPVQSLWLSPDGRRLAFVSAPARRGLPRLGLVDTATGLLRSRELALSTGPLWLSNRRLAVPGERRVARRFDTRLRRRGVVASWATDRAVVSAGRVWWLEHGAGLRGRALRSFASSRLTIEYLSGARGLVAVRGGARVTDASGRAPSVTAARTAVAGLCGSQGSD